MELPEWSAVWLKDREMPEITTKIIPREVWGALPPKGGIDPLPTPVEYVGYSCNKEITWNKCNNQQDCSKICRMMQKKHMADGLPDIKYNFMIGNDGNVYEGRGWNKRPQIYYERPNRKSLHSLIDVSYIGISESNYLPESMFGVFDALVKMGKEAKYLKEDCTERDFCDTLELGPRGEKDKFESDEEEEEEEGE